MNPKEIRALYMQHLKLKNVNIDIVDNTKMEAIGHYWDEQTVSEIRSPSNEYDHLFLQKFIELKDI